MVAVVGRPEGVFFNAFTPSDGPKMDQADVIHAGWAHRDHSNLSLLEATNMDTRDTILLEAHMREYKKRDVVRWNRFFLP